MKKIITSLSVLFCSLFCTAESTQGYTNPIIPGFYPDPSVCRVGDDYYLVNSTFQYFPGVPIFHSKDLIHWQQIGNVLDRESQLPLGGANGWLGIYAPTIRYNNGIYYMVTTNIGNGGNFFVTATNPAGPWGEPIWLKQGAIDPSLFFEDGKCYMTSNPEDKIWMCEIDPATGKQLTESKVIWSGTGGRYPEAAHIYKKDGWYYLMLAEDGTEMGHKVTIARSRNIYGPYESNPDNPILTHQKQATQTSPIQGTGHADLVEAADGSWWMVCLAFRPQTNGLHLTGRETYLAPVTWNENGWPVVNGNGSIALDMNVTTLPQTTATSRAINLNFATTDKLGYDWVYLRNPEMDNYKLTPSGLELKGSELSVDATVGSPTFVAHRQQDINFTAETIVSLNNASSGAQAGMTVYMETHSHYDIYLRQNDNSTQSIVLRYKLNAIEGEKVLASAIPSGKVVTLKVVGSADNYDFYCSYGNRNIKLGSLDTRYLSTETAGGFTGIMLGLYATGNGIGLFKSFSYTPGD